MSNPTVFLERYQSSKPIEPQKFLVYQIQRTRTDPAVNLLTLARAIVDRINNGKVAFFACTDDEYIYTIKPLASFYLAGHSGNQYKQTYCEYELNLLEKRVIPFSNTAVYNQYIGLLIGNKALNHHPGPGIKQYTLRNGKIYSRYIYDEEKKQHLQITNINYETGENTEPSSVILSRNYQISPEIKEDGFFTVSLMTKVNFDATKTLYGLVHTGEKTASELMGYTVKYILATGLEQVGVVVSEKEYLAANPGKDPKKDASVESTRNYFLTTYPKNRMIQEFIQKDIQQRPDNFIVYVRINATTVYQYLASTLCPVMTTEYVAETYRDFSKAVSKYTRIDMATRIRIDQEFLGGVGTFPELGNDIYLVPYPCKAENEGYSPLLVELPKLRIGHNQLIYPKWNDKRKFFQENAGYYSIPDTLIEKNELCINILGDSSKFKENHLRLFLAYLYRNGLEHSSPAFAVHNEQHFSIKLKIYLVNYWQGPQAILDTMHKMNQESPSDINIIILDQFNKKIPANFHDELKEELSWKDIPSQMVDANTVWTFLWDYEQQESKRKGTSLDFEIPYRTRKFLSEFKSVDKLRKFIDPKRENLILQILAKLGCVPAILEQPLPGNIDLILGLDVGMLERGIHYPGCSVMIDNQGRYLGMYAPNHAQHGEKIPTKLLKTIFNQSLTFYAEVKGSMPSRILIMRDGFSNEDDAFYATYFGERNIQYDIVEVRKNCGLRLATGYVSSYRASFNNPPIGTCILKGNEGFLVTTEGFYSGAPRPIKVVHTVGELPMQDVMQICYSLTKLYPGSMQNVRLPYPTYVADKVCKAYDRIPHDLITAHNFFM